MKEFYKLIADTLIYLKEYFFSFLTFKNIFLYLGAIKSKKHYNIINFNEIRYNIKKSNTVVIFGTGSSINKLRRDEWKKLRKFNSICLGHFAEHDYKKRADTEIVHVKESGHWGLIAKNSQLENLKEVLNYIVGIKKSKNYKKKIFFLQKGISAKCSNFILDNQLLPFKSKIAFYRSSKLSQLIPNLNKSSDNLNGYSGSLSMAISFAIKLGWKKIILAGVDLDNNQYFYYKKNKTVIWNSTHKVAIKVNDAHTMKNRTLTYLDSLKKILKSRKIKIYTLNKKSIVGKILPKFDLRKN